MYGLFYNISNILIIVVAASVSNAFNTLESPIREAFLRPKNFNPHPYELRNYQANNLLSQAPHQFPPTVQRSKDASSLPNYYISSRKYADIFQSNDVVDIRNRNFQRIDPNTSKKQYAFSYTVRDTESGDDFSHTQHQKNGAISGTYKVQLPDGRTQVVRYKAGNNGYRADVSYLFDKNALNNVALNTLAKPKTIFDSYWNDNLVHRPAKKPYLVYI